MAEKRAAIHVLGCKVNQNEAEVMQGLFRRSGYRIVRDEEPADVYVIHTCTVTHLADRKCRQVIRRAVKANPEAVIAVTGCYAQTSPGEILSIPGVDLVVGTQDRGRIAELVDMASQSTKPVNLVRELPNDGEFEDLPLEGPGRVRAFLKIQEGCRQYCSYCIVPFARGPVRSRVRENVVAEVSRLVAEGFREVVLTGIHTGAYGLDLPPGETLARLLKDLVKIPGLARLRLSSLDSNEFTTELTAVMTGEDKICPHYHIPLQSGDDGILKKMNRRYDGEAYASVISNLRQRRPEASITTDVIVGFPGESGEAFRNTVNLIKEVQFSQLHVFKYSRRAGTRAAEFPGHLTPETKEKRSKELLELSRELYISYASRFIGRLKEVLVEQETVEGSGLWEGYTDNYLRVIFPAIGKLRGQMVPVKLNGMTGEHLEGESKSTPLGSKEMN
ncbi:MAG: tRNA (N(6)-L-threonylcarbamoyladenosine(37)-C(2))-methylthiotransferase MtaB [Bacillota bacterium]